VRLGEQGACLEAVSERDELHEALAMWVTLFKWRARKRFVSELLGWC